MDANQAELVRMIQQLGGSVQVLSDVGLGVPDLLVGWRQRNVLLEVKNPQQRWCLTKDEELWHKTWRGQVAVVQTLDEVLRVLDVRR